MLTLQILIGVVAVPLMGILAAIADVATHLNAIQWVLENTVTEAIKNLDEPLQKLDEIQGDLDSLHSIIGGRLWKKDAVDIDTDGPTLQDLLRSIKSI